MSMKFTKLVLVVAVDKRTGDELDRFDIFFNREEADRSADSANCVAGGDIYYRVVEFDREGDD